MVDPVTPKIILPTPTITVSHRGVKPEQRLMELAAELQQLRQLVHQLNDRLVKIERER